jgi:hypothetical protein
MSCAGMSAVEALNLRGQGQMDLYSQGLNKLKGLLQNFQGHMSISIEAVDKQPSVIDLRQD